MFYSDTCTDAAIREFCKADCGKLESKFKIKTCVKKCTALREEQCSGDPEPTKDPDVDLSDLCEKQWALCQNRCANHKWKKKCLEKCMTIEVIDAPHVCPIPDPSPEPTKDPKPTGDPKPTKDPKPTGDPEPTKEPEDKCAALWARCEKQCAKSKWSKKCIQKCVEKGTTIEAFDQPCVKPDPTVEPTQQPDKCDVVLAGCEKRCAKKPNAFSKRQCIEKCMNKAGCEYDPKPTAKPTKTPPTKKPPTKTPPTKTPPTKTPPTKTPPTKTPTTEPDVDFFPDKCFHECRHNCPTKAPPTMPTSPETRTTTPKTTSITKPTKPTTTASPRLQLGCKTSGTKRFCVYIHTCISTYMYIFFTLHAVRHRNRPVDFSLI